MEFNILYYIVLSFASLQIYISQIKKLDIKDQMLCLQIFKSNNYLGLIILFGLIMGKINY